jgi:hypothetical protein
MKPLLTLLALLVVPHTLAQTTVRVYPDGHALVHTSQTIWLRGGNNTIHWQPVSAKLDPASVRLHAVERSLDILSQRFLHDRDGLLSLYRGQEIQVGDTIGTLIAADKQRVSILQTEDGQLILNPEGPITLPALDPAPALQPTLFWQLNTVPRGELPLTLSYRSKDIHWTPSASLTFTADMSTAALDTAITLSNNATVDFIDTRWFAMNNPEDADEAYPLPGRHSLSNGDSIRIPTLALPKLPVSSLYTFDPVTEGKTQVKQRLASRIRIKLPADLPATGVPAGSAALSRRHESGAFDTLGSHKLGTLRADATIDIKLGDSPDLQGERKQSPFKELPDGKAQEQEITITLHNNSDVPFQAEAIEHPWGTWEIIEPSHPFQKAGKNVVFAVDIPAKGKTTISYRLRIAY